MRNSRKRPTPGLTNLAYEIAQVSAVEAEEVVYQNAVLVQATLPHRDPGAVPAWGRSNGRANIYIQPGVELQGGAYVSSGIPYGSYPRLVLIYLITEVVKKRSKRVHLGTSLANFMSHLGLLPTGGRWGTIPRLREQMKRLFSAKIGIHYDAPSGFHHEQALIATRIELWWDAKRPEQASLFESHVTLTEEFYQAVLNAPVPLDMRVLRTIKQSPLALDLYMWLSYRVARLVRGQVLVLAWDQLHEQLGSEYGNMKDFAREVRAELKRIKTVWPELEYETPRGRLFIKGIPPHVPKLK